jgi:sugar lactone lactonase YvrE
MATSERLLPSIRNQLGEGPLWNIREGRFYWVDIEDNCFYTYDPASEEAQRYDIGLMPGCLGFLESGGLVIGTQNGLAIWNPQSQKVAMFTDNIAYRPAGRFNDGATDRQGRFWAGTMTDKPENHLFRLDPDGGVQVMETGVTISNGLGWSPDDRTMYYSDSGHGVIYAYDFDPTTGDISNRRVLVAESPEGDAPDGLTVDSEGFIWCARWGGWKVVRYDPQGGVEREIRLPVKHVTSCAFGGPELTDLYITSASSPLSAEELQQFPDSGGLFRLRTDVKGLPEPYVTLSPDAIARAEYV